MLAKAIKTTKWQALLHHSILAIYHQLDQAT